jgi:hypothetical protein
MLLHQPSTPSNIKNTAIIAPSKPPSQTLTSNQATESETPTSLDPNIAPFKMSRLFTSLTKHCKFMNDPKISHILKSVSLHFDALIRQRDNKINKLENSLNYFYQKFIKAKKKLNLLSKNLVKIQNFEKSESFESRPPFVNKPLFLNKNSENLPERKSNNHKILQSIIGAKSYVNQRKVSQGLGIESVLSLHRTFDQSVKPSFYDEVLSFETEKQNFRAHTGDVEFKVEGLPNFYDKVQYKKKRGILENGKYVLVEGERERRKEVYLKEKNKGQENIQMNGQSKQKSTIKKVEKNEKEFGNLEETNKKVYILKKKKQKLSFRNSKKMSRSNKKNILKDSQNIAFFYKNKKTKEKQDEKSKIKTKKKDINKKTKTRTSNQNKISRKNALSVKTGSGKIKGTKKYMKRNKGNNSNKIISSRVKNLKYSSSDQKIEFNNHTSYKNEFLQLKTPIIGVEKLKFPKYLKVLHNLNGKNKERLNSGNKRKMFKDFNLAKNIQKFNGKDKQPQFQNVFNINNTNSSSLKNLKNGFNNLHLNYIFSQNKNLEQEHKVGFKLNTLFSKQTPKASNSIKGYSKKSGKNGLLEFK